ncbi:cell wall hydrolase [Streptomyces sp. NPDC003077]|uniref:cell wall hydrolase n=1 Tax=Streptomyces sp. NPDC003077 TaxID=3154443 RepID=UPI0033A677ED
MAADALSHLPAALRHTPYAGARHPGTVVGADGPWDAVASAATGANCQLYAYAVLAHFGHRLPPLRSAELWADTTATAPVHPALPPDLVPLDLVLFDGGPVPGRPDGYGAHVGVHLGPDRVLHLCREVGRPAVWSYADFSARARYARFLGAKRAHRARLPDRNGLTPPGSPRFG